MPKVYLIGSLRNPKIPEIANKIREAGFEVFDDWYAAGPEADDYWQKYETGRGHTYSEALRGAAAANVFEFDRKHLLGSDMVVLACPAGKSAHLELGWCLGKGIPGFILYEDTPERYDVMYKFADGVFDTLPDLIEELKLSGLP